jgi:hypothetical protein
VKTELFPKDSVLELNTTKLGNSPIFLTITHATSFDIQFSRYGFLKSGFSAGQILDRLVYRCLVRFLGQKMSETCWGLNIISESHLLSFPMPTQTHVFDAYSYGYGHFGTTMCGVSGLLKIGLSNGLEPLARLWTAVRLRLFKLVIKLG